MYIKIQPHSPSKEIGRLINYLDKGNEQKRVVNYLDKQNQDLKQASTIEYFFNSEQKNIDKNEVIGDLSKDHKGLKKEEAKFFMLTLSPSQSELKHLEGLYGSDKEALKEYTKDIMRGYGACMNREIEGRPLEEKDLRWYGMYEDSRKYGRGDHEVLHNRDYRKLERAIEKGDTKKETKERLSELGGFYVLDKEGKVQKRMKEEKGEVKIKEGLKKAGKHGHVHVLVHRKDRSGKISLSPLVNARGTERLVKRYARDGKPMTKAKAEQLSKSLNKPIEEVVEIREIKLRMGFDRTYFARFSQAAFDHKFNYKRDYGDSFEGYNERKKDPGAYKESQLHILKYGVPKKQEEIKKTEQKPLEEKVEKIGEKKFKSFSQASDEDQKFKGEKEFKRDRATKKDAVEVLKKGVMELPKEVVKSVGKEIKNQVIDRDLQSGYRVVLKEGLDLAKALASGNPKILALTLVKKGITVPLKLGKALIESDSISM